MKMTGFQIQNYRCINDSGWIEIDDIDVIVGKNESGKTSLLKALWKFNPFRDEPYNLDREWPRGRRKDRSPEQPVATVEFTFIPDEIEELQEIDDSISGINGVRIVRNYKGTYIYEFLPHNPDSEHKLKWVISVIKEHMQELPDGVSGNFQNSYNTVLANFIQNVRENQGVQFAVQNVQQLKQEIQNCVQPNHAPDNNAVNQLHQRLDSAVKELQIDPPFQRAIDTVHEWLPVFIYMNDQTVFKGSAYLDQIQQRKRKNNMTDEDKTIIMIMEMAGLDFDEEVQKGNESDREQRMLDMSDASRTLTETIAHRWSQNPYVVQFNADGQHFITFVKGIDDKALVPLDERSLGFQWFFAFDMTFMYETDGEFENAIILLDEPGLHLHAAAQRDLLKRIKDYAQNNQLIYSTHLPFMIDFTRLDNIYVAEQRDEGARVHSEWATAGEDARFTLQAAMGLSWSHALFVGQFNLVVEGVTDFWYLTSISTMLQDAEESGIDESLVIIPVGGASKAAYISTILHGQELNVAVLLDSDKEGKTAYEQLVHNWILEQQHILMLGEILGLSYPCAIEDLFDEGYYLQWVHEAYKKELGSTKLKLKRGKQSIVDKVSEALQSQGIEHFNKGRVGKRIMKDLASKDLHELGDATVDNFKAVIEAINKIVSGWRE